MEEMAMDVQHRHDYYYKGCATIEGHLFINVSKLAVLIFKLKTLATKKVEPDMTTAAWCEVSPPLPAA